jgi:hypothetical protein
MNARWMALGSALVISGAAYAAEGQVPAAHSGVSPKGQHYIDTFKADGTFSSVAQCPKGRSAPDCKITDTGTWRLKGEGKKVLVCRTYNDWSLPEQCEPAKFLPRGSAKSAERRSS